MKSIRIDFRRGSEEMAEEAQSGKKHQTKKAGHDCHEGSVRLKSGKNLKSCTLNSVS